MFCPKCGEIVRDTALKCPCCGASLRGSSSKVNKDCDHRHAQPDTAESRSSGTWENPAQWDQPRKQSSQSQRRAQAQKNWDEFQSQVKIFGQTITHEKAEAYRNRFNQQGAGTFSQSFTQEQFSSKTEEVIALMKRFFMGYKDFSGRTSRREFWLTTAIVFFGFLFLSIFLPALGILVSMALLPPSIAMAVRRLHDTGKSGKALLVGLFPYLGFFLLLYWYSKPSDPGNQWGPQPRG